MLDRHRVYDLVVLFTHNRLLYSYRATAAGTHLLVPTQGLPGLAVLVDGGAKRTFAVPTCFMAFIMFSDEK